LISKKVLLKERKELKCIKHALKADYKSKSELELSKNKETKNSPTDGEEVNPQARDQSNKTPMKISNNLSIAVSLSSKVRLFLSHQIVHIRQEGIRFHTSEDFFPNQLCQPYKRSETRDGST
jgi:hypothetical protein